MVVLRNILILLWRIWFYIMMGIPIIILFPILLILTSREQWYAQFFVVARFWAKIVLYGSGFIPRVKNETKIDPQRSYMFVANHTSMADIMLMLYCVKNPFVFVGKKELAKIPIFGFFYKRTCILVDRSSQKSRKEVFDRAQARLQDGTSICIFPEGGVPEDESVLLDEFKDGAFRLAIDHQIPILPLTFLDNKRRFSYTFFSGSPGKMRAYVHKEILTEGFTQERKKELNMIARNVILDKLKSNQL
ncbi:1-acyl-sn-glycerol-3-phosphate acyltransferase [Aquimarina sp. MMG015]|uniref:lysophospholipid acyltransferase family protein n=1 Tax=unclassified Aquimarina TaxID=2627091 RepID=UPI000E53AE0A|nr:MULTISPECIES: lysophospholipid acyltransferase family protein [unclassified Aquimarina]AXT57483.1 1-acyl-sn-glycerol-3-phosphate acyltransferase [Aquimarina sp. AD1]MBQ4801266.1 1-acyl-sn-glycerol-3-phosphate acyltransferase [Aquimarina sp. MMG015]RKN35745.1 1-acylglycerol-3-phosphate O-acyltransferase [Aquimarina sp. AD1]